MQVALADTEVPVRRACGPLAVAVSVAGPGHTTAGRDCEDAAACRVSGDTVLIAVADGLGSVSRGGEGASIAVRTALRAGEGALEHRLLEPGEIVEQMAAAARQSLEASAPSARDLACTLIACVLEGGVAAAAHIGDGAVVGTGDAGLMLISPPGSSEYVNEVEHLGQDRWREALRISIAEPVSQVALFTDGLQRAALQKKEGRWVPFDGFLLPLLEHAAASTDDATLREELAGLLQGPRLSDHSEDDKTIALAMSRPPSNEER